MKIGFPWHSMVLKINGNCDALVLLDVGEVGDADMIFGANDS